MTQAGDSKIKEIPSKNPGEEGTRMFDALRDYGGAQKRGFVQTGGIAHKHRKGVEQDVLSTNGGKNFYYETARKTDEVAENMVDDVRNNRKAAGLRLQLTTVYKDTRRLGKLIGQQEQNRINYQRQVKESETAYQNRYDEHLNDGKSSIDQLAGPSDPPDPLAPNRLPPGIGPTRWSEQTEDALKGVKVKKRDS